MRKILCAAFVLVMLAEQAMAAWTDKFTEDFKDLGMYDAVKNALSADVKPHDILAFVKKNPDMFETELSMKALYCAGEDVDAVQEAASQLGITEVEIGKALAESKKECGSMLNLTDRDIVEPPNHGNLSGTPPQKGGVPADGGTPPAAPPASDNGKSKEKKAASPSLPPMPPVGPPPSPSTL
ncbi:hypothetical protein [Candidatus Electronema sp. JC]|uniref:hypothetical protein n=1 Tax=Candidatus Electronema sp. JC TaxID=3401570 RepID=UPI003B42B172